MILHQTLGAVSLCVAFFLLCWYCLRKFWERAYQKGWKAAEEWIVKLETGVDEERQKIWREGR